MKGRIGLRHSIIAVVLLSAFSCCLLPLASILSGGAGYILRPFYRVRITEMRPCHSLDAETGLPIGIEKPLTTKDELLQVCAHMEVSYSSYVGIRGYPIPLYFLWRYEGAPEYLSETRTYSPGYIVGSLRPRVGKPLKPGTYQVEIRGGRSLYASMEFSVVPGG